MAELQRLGPYEIRGVLGMGGAATVYRAWDGAREVALKVLHRGLVEGEGFVERFNREMEIVWRLKHPNVLRIFDAGFEETEGRYYFAMELVEGRTAREVLERVHRLSLAESLVVLLAILSALDHAHGKGVIHRDIKSENVFLAEGGRIVLMDFGIARELEKSSVTGASQRVGTPLSMAPECFIGTSLGARADVYAAGLLLYELLTGHAACPDGSPDGARRFHLYAAPVPPRELLPELPETLNALILKALEKDPDRRFSTAGAMADALRRWARNAGVALPDGLPPSAPAPLTPLPAPQPLIPDGEGELPEGLRRLVPRRRGEKKEEGEGKGERDRGRSPFGASSGPLKRTLVELGLVLVLCAAFLAWRGRGSGYLSVTSYPGEADVLVGGSPVGKTPIALLRLPTGKTTLRLRGPEGEDRSVEIRIRSGRITVLHLRL